MKVIILAGGLGTRILEETFDKPKPMVLINNRPILWHIMNIFAKQGFNKFIVASGYKSEIIEKWVSALDEPWEITVYNTGLNTQTGGRIFECMKQIPSERVLVTYGDGLGNVNINDLIHFHFSQSKLATVTAVRPPARFGVLQSQNGLVTKFGEKNQVDSGWINGGFFVLEGAVADYIHNIQEPFETGALPRLVTQKQLAAYHHNGFWQPMDTIREKQELERIALLDPPSWLSSI